MPKKYADHPYSLRCLSAIEGFLGSRVNLAKELGCNPQTIALWHFKRRIPSHQVLNLVKCGEDKFSAEELLGRFDSER